MACFSGPEIPNDGLVFCYDQGNTDKSWKGAPTTNIVTNWNLDTGWSQGYCTDIIFNEIPPPYGVDAPTVGFRDADGNGSGYWYSYGNYAPGQTPGSTMTVSLYVKISGPDCSIRCYTADNSETGRVQGSYITVSQSEGWKRCVWTIVIPNPSTSESLSFQFVIPATTRMWLCAPQMESGSFATPFVAGTRSNTQALLDMTGQNTVTATSLTYASDGSFSFNGTSDGINVSSNSVLNVGNNITVNAWFFVNSSTYQPIVSKVLSDGSLGWEIANSSGTFRTTLRPTNTQINLSAGTLTIGNWYMGTMTFDGVTARLYINGVQTGSTSTGGPVTLNSTQPLQIGTRGIGPNWYNGNIPQVSLYNRALSAEEVQQNFNALKGRYGI